MGSSVPSSRLIRFGVFELDLRSGEIQKQGRKIRLEGQPVHVLICLLENRGELVTREELHRKLWPADTFVNFEHGLNAAVKRLRQALNDSADNPRFVETLPRRGYRFIAPIQVVAASESVSGVNGAVNDAASAAEAPATRDLPETKHDDRADLSEKTVVVEPQRRPPALKRFGFAFLVMLGICAAWILRPGSGPPQVIRSLAVLPLENLSGD